METVDQLELAWEARGSRRLLDPDAPHRIFHGPGDGKGSLSRITIDWFPPGYAWIVAFDDEPGERLIGQLERFLVGKKALGAVVIVRRKGDAASAKSRLAFGNIPTGRVVVKEKGLQFFVELIGVRQPGIFIDHRPLREWLMAHEENGEVLNLFSYTGALSVAAGRQASRVTSVDLSKPSNLWASENWKLNGLAPERGAFVTEDALKWLDRDAKRGKTYGTVILDPPTFARAGKRVFSTEKHLGELHAKALAVLARSGCLVTSINSSSVPRKAFKAIIEEALSAKKRKARFLHSIELPQTFAAPGEGYLKGFCLEVI